MAFFGWGQSSRGHRTCRELQLIAKPWNKSFCTTASWMFLKINKGPKNPIGFLKVESWDEFWHFVPKWCNDLSLGCLATERP